jgi:two-component system, NtrC family, nitrogen regulation sensor histidine kinase NtrY
MKKIFHSTLSVLALITLVFILLTTGFILFQKAGMRPENITAHITTVTQERWEQLLKRTHRFERELKLHHEPFMNTFDGGQFLEDHMTFSVKKGDEVIYWLSNEIPLDQIPDDLIGKRILKLSNGYYQVYQIHPDSLTITGLSLICHQYPYTNRYLDNGFEGDYHVPVSPEIVEEIGKYNVTTRDGSFLFSLKYPSVSNPSGTAAIIGFLLFLATYTLLNILLLLLHRAINPWPKRQGLSLLFFILDALIIRFLIHYFAFPTWIHRLPIFDLGLYGSSMINSSLGDLLLNVVLTLIMVSAVSLYYKPDTERIRKRWMIAVLYFLLIAVCLYNTLQITRSLITDSTLTISFTDLGNIGRFGLIGLVIILISGGSFILLANRLLQIVVQTFAGLRQTIFILLPVVILSCLPLLRAIEPITVAFPLIFLILITGIHLQVYYKINHVFRIIWLCITVSISITWMINAYTQMKGKERRLMVAEHFARKEDPLAEEFFAQARESIYHDTLLAGMLFTDSLDEGLIINYLLQRHFTGGKNYWSKYNFQVTICNQDQKLTISGDNTVIDCYGFFNRLILESGIMTGTQDLALIKDQEGHHNYLGILRFENLLEDSRQDRQIYIEIFPKAATAGNGYLELMADEKMLGEGNLSLYANARYQDGQLIASYGKYIYSTDLLIYPAVGQGDDHIFFEKGGYSHLLFKTGDGSVLLVSEPEKNFIDLAAPLAVFLMAFLLLYSVIWLLHQMMGHGPSISSTFRGRLRLALTGVVMVSFIMVGATSIYYIRVLNKNKNTGNLTDKARSIRIELEHKLADKEILSEEMKPYIQSLLLKFAEVFATDINLYDSKGNMLGSSREKLFEEGITGNKINPEAFREMTLNRKTLLIHEENIGNLTYLSAYIPFRNNHNRVIAYINLPYFSRQSELSSEISSFMMAYINIYLLLIAFAIAFAFTLTGMILKPLLLLRDRIRRVQLGAENEKIEWVKKDEIGELVDEYNRMIDELDKSAQLLAKSERESAWQEMARQVAHEIKNPLTPMKLNLQHLQKTLAEGSPTWNQQFDRYARMMHEQINSLSEIASAFSDFANLPEMKLQEFSLSSALDHAVSLYTPYAGVSIVKMYDSATYYGVKGDMEQVKRMFINIISNAIQAAFQDRQLTVYIAVKEDGGHWSIDIADDGKGIDEGIRDKIFTPNFTTKSSGMGLGLAIARSIVHQMGGEINFVSETGVGTTFNITLPVAGKL